MSGVGEYTFEVESMNGWYLTVDNGVNINGIPFLAKVSREESLLDPRHRFAIVASKKDL